MGLRSFLDKIEHNFEKGGKHEKWYALYEAFDTFFYRPSDVTRTTAHVRDGLDPQTTHAVMVCQENERDALKAAQDQYRAGTGPCPSFHLENLLRQNYHSKDS